jgi:hypothetical protein
VKRPVVIEVKEKAIAKGVKLRNVLFIAGW